MRDVDNEGGGYAYVTAGGIWEISVLSAQFCRELKNALKKSLLFKIRDAINNHTRTRRIN